GRAWAYTRRSRMHRFSNIVPKACQSCTSASGPLPSWVAARDGSARIETVGATLSSQHGYGDNGHAIGAAIGEASLPHNHAFARWRGLTGQRHFPLKTIERCGGIVNLGGSQFHLERTPRLIRPLHDGINLKVGIVPI